MKLTPEQIKQALLDLSPDGNIVWRNGLFFVWSTEGYDEQQARKAAVQASWENEPWHEEEELT